MTPPLSACRHSLTSPALRADRSNWRLEGGLAASSASAALRAVTCAGVATSTVACCDVIAASVFAASKVLEGSTTGEM